MSSSTLLANVRYSNGNQDGTIFMGILEQQMLSTYPHKPFIYFRYIDDEFMIWTEGEDSLNTFLEHCNTEQNKHTKFKSTGTETAIPFLDVSVTLKNRNLNSDLYCNPLTNISTYITQAVTLNTQKIAYHIALLYADVLFSLRADEMKQQRGYSKNPHERTTIFRSQAGKGSSGGGAFFRSFIKKKTIRAR